MNLVDESIAGIIAYARDDGICVIGDIDRSVRRLVDEMCSNSTVMWTPYTRRLLNVGNARIIVMVNVECASPNFFFDSILPIMSSVIYMKLVIFGKLQKSPFLNDLLSKTHVNGEKFFKVV